ncbi:MAG TPA: ATPase domain-containing protein [Burkholderiales bacterium]|nr:ATPase domain-containing protein [Burkholderiales bacterium]
MVQSGNFDLTGMLAMLKAKKEEMGARWIVFDGIDVLLTLLQDPIAEMREIYRIRDWLAENEMSALITAKVEGASSEVLSYGFMQFMVDCVVGLERRLEYGVALHRIEITKYRGSDFVAGEYPVNFGPSGMEVGAPEPTEIRHEASSERLSAGFERLDTMLGGGLFRGSSTLITGVPGTSKTTLAGKFAEAACLRGERTLFVSFDEGSDPIQRNLASVGIHLKPHVKSGLLRMYSGRTESIGAEDHLLKLKSLIREHRPRCMVIDPLSAIAKAGGIDTARAVANRLIYLVKDEKVTVMITAMNEGDDPQAEATELQISTVADTWIHLSYLVRSGERNRALTIIKSRGTWHSNQVRELVLGKAGPALADVYTAGGEVLMGTLRWEKEDEERTKTQQRIAAFDHKRSELEAAEAETRARIKTLQQELDRHAAALALYTGENQARIVSSSEREQELRRIRSADPATRAANGGMRGGGKASRRQRFQKSGELIPGGHNEA